MTKQLRREKEGYMETIQGLKAANEENMYFGGIKEGEVNKIGKKTEKK